MASSFGWKRKRKTIAGKVAAHFKEDGGQDDEVESSCVDWLAVAKKRKLLLLEDNQAKAKRLQEEGATLAESGRYWEAVKYWNEALELSPQCAALHEMKSQVLLELNELFPAVEAAERAASLEPTWAVAWQTLGRAQTSLGEIEMALSSVQKSVHLDPCNEEVRDDMRWVQELIEQKKKKSAEIKAREARKRADILEKLAR